jgi:formylglycine-generating enzyme required for sulfatase activity
MAGNVREWVLDYFDKSYYKDGTETDNPKGPSQGQDRVIKGSSFKTTGANAYKISRRDQAKDGASAEDLGFRCAISVYPAAP